MGSLLKKDDNNPFDLHVYLNSTPKGARSILPVFESAGFYPVPLSKDRFYLQSDNDLQRPILYSSLGLPKIEPKHYVYLSSRFYLQANSFVRFPQFKFTKREFMYFGILLNSLADANYAFGVGISQKNIDSTEEISDLILAENSVIQKSVEMRKRYPYICDMIKLAREINDTRILKEPPKLKKTGSSYKKEYLFWEIDE